MSTFKRPGFGRVDTDHANDIPLSEAANGSSSKGDWRDDEAGTGKGATGEVNEVGENLPAFDLLDEDHFGEGDVVTTVRHAITIAPDHN